MLDFAEFNLRPNTPAESFTCSPPDCFIGSYPPITPAGEMGPFFVNTYLLQPNRRMEVVGTVAVRSGDLELKK